MTNRNSGKALYAGALSDVIGCAMATYIVVEDKIPEWQDWLRAKILMHSEDDDPEVLKMYQVMASAPLEIIEASVELHVSINRERARQLSEITEGMNLND